ncbi:hypothetical protein HHK36_032763 [Tetracentron sinense]|uniref:Uncharacterized protein n=1 Tax=Tetracentron sinense TaxID=13715 RepID=A0A834Y7J2_TETSI|nr:hypothetical protein HHK36_032763 [Tetracentron sinense]
MSQYNSLRRTVSPCSPFFPCPFFPSPLHLRPRISRRPRSAKALKNSATSAIIATFCWAGPYYIPTASIYSLLLCLRSGTGDSHDPPKPADRSVLQRRCTSSSKDDITGGMEL